MKKELITNKSNALTEAKTGELRLFDDKLINVLYYMIENLGEEILKLNLLDIKRLLNINTNNYIELILQSLERLDNRKISLRNIKYKGRNIDWMRSSVIKEMILFSDSRSHLEIEISRAIIEGMKQKSNFTPLDINICNQFKSKYGLKIYELYKRYENFTTNHHLFMKDSESCFSISMDEATERFGNNFAHASKWKEAFNRGLKEIKLLTDKNIDVTYSKQDKLFLFYWVRPNINIDLKTFKTHIRKTYINKIIYKHTQKNNKQIELSVNTEGKLYNQLDTTPIKAVKAYDVWKWLFENQSRIIKYKGELK